MQFSTPQSKLQSEVKSDVEQSKIKVENTKEVFDLQVTLAQAYARIHGISLEEAVKLATPWNRLIGNAFLPSESGESVWEELDFNKPDELAIAAYNLHCRNIGADPFYQEITTLENWGYTVDFEKRRFLLHFTPNLNSQTNPFSSQSLERSIKEIQQLIFICVQDHPEIRELYGASWMVSFPPFRRIMDGLASEIGSKAIYNNLEIWFRSSSLYGQFIGIDGTIKPERAEQFKRICEVAMTDEDLSKAFPFGASECTIPFQEYNQQLSSI
jgi:hypothetical protein